MNCLTILLLLAASVLAVPAKAQMTLPQQRMFEAMRGVNNLNEQMKAAEEGVRSQREKEEAHRVSYFRIAVVAGAIWLYIRRRRGQAAQSSAKSGT